MFTEHLITTSHADIAVRTTAGTGLPLLLLHGNSSDSSVFRHQMEAPLADVYRMIAIDLPGHGRSGQAIDGKRTYSMPGYADMAVELLDRLGIEQAAVYGWSLGGHIGIEMISRFPGMAGLMISGTPPVSPTPESIGAGFRPSPVVPLFGQETLSEAEVDLFFEGTYGPGADPALRAAIRRTDGVARRLMFESLFSGSTGDQRAIVETTKVPLAIVDGELDPFVNLDYIDALSIGSLWEKHSFVLRGAGHAAFFTHPARFNAILGRFLKDVATRSRRPKPARRVAAA